MSCIISIEAINHMHAMPWVIWNTNGGEATPTRLLLRLWSMHACMWSEWRELGENDSQHHQSCSTILKLT
jgi:hypothetical protein